MADITNRSTVRVVDVISKLSFLKKFSVKQRLIFFSGCSLSIVFLMVVIQFIASASTERALRIREGALEVNANLLNRQNIANLLVSKSDTSLISVYEMLSKKGVKAVKQFANSGAMKRGDAKKLMALNESTDSLFGLLHKTADKKNEVMISLNRSIDESDKSVGTILTLLEAREADLQMMGERLSAKESEFLNVARDGRIFFLMLKGLIQSLQINQELDVSKEFKALTNRKNSIFDAYKSFSLALKNDAYTKASDQFVSSTQNAITQSESLIRVLGEQYVITKEFDKEVKLTSEITEDQLKNADRSVTIAKGTVVVVYVVVLLLTAGVFIVLSLSLIVSITSPINRLLELMDKIGKGDLSVEIPVESNDEISQIASSLKTTVTNLRGMFTKIKTSSETIFLQTENVTKIASNVASTIKNQRTKSSQLNSTGSKVLSTVARISETTVEMSNSVTGAAAAIEEMGVSISDVSRSCQEESKVAIQADNEARSAETIMQQLGESASQITMVIDVISKISEQTKLLALNATIESARAGSAGKGFAVVASEVNELAKQTAEAAEDVRKQVSGMQHNTGNAISAIKKIGDTIHLISEHSDTIAIAVGEQSSVVNTIAQTMAHTSTSAKTIADNVTSSAHGLSEVNTGIQDVDSSLHGTVTSIDEIHQRIRELNELGADLKKMVDQFTI